MKILTTLTLATALAALPPTVVFAETVPALVLKYDFERADVTANWRQDLGKDTIPDKISVDASVAHSGQSALKFEIANDADKPRHVYSGAKLSVTQDGEGRSVRLRLFARTSGVAAGEASVSILERDSTKVLGWLEKKQTLLPLEASADWKEYEVSCSLSPSARVITLFVFLKNPRAGQTIWLDDVSVELLQP